MRRPDSLPNAPGPDLLDEAAISELAVRLRNGGAEGTLDSLRAMAALDRLLARDPLDRLAPFPPEPADDEDDRRPGACTDIVPALPVLPDDPVTDAPPPLSSMRRGRGRGQRQRSMPPRFR